MKRVVCIVLCVFLAFGALRCSATDISAKAAVVIDGYTGQILYSYNCDERLPMASTTKIMSALLLCELGGDLSREIVTTREMVTVEGSSMGLLEGDTVSLHDLLYGMMLSSGNDAANTTAIAIGGSVSGFVELMNKRAQEMGLVNTHFATPSGLDAADHYTTAYELALIAKEALANEQFSKAAASECATLCYGNPPYNRTLTNHNKLLRMYDDVVGVKTGYTKKSGRCLVSASEKDGKLVIAVTLNDPSDWADHRKLLDLGLSLIEAKEFSAAQKNITVPVAGGAQGAEASAEVPSATINVTENSKITYAVCVPHFLYAPIKPNEEIGSIVYYCDEKPVSTQKIIASNEVLRKSDKLNLFLEIFKYLVSNI